MPKSIPERLSFRCDNRWSDMTPRGPGRHCAECDTTVIDISRLTEKEALRRTAGGACVRLRFDQDGAPIFRAAPSRRRGLVIAAALLGGCGASGAPAEEAPVVEAEPPASAPLAAVALEPAPPVPAGLAVADLGDLAELEASLNDWRHEGGPTAEQLALTRAKRRRRQPVAPPVASPPPHQVFMGMMDPDW